LKWAEECQEVNGLGETTQASAHAQVSTLPYSPTNSVNTKKVMAFSSAQFAVNPNEVCITLQPM